MNKLEIRLFGRLSIRFGSEDVSGLESAKVQELFCFLLLNRDRPLPRSTVASTLWGETCTTSNSRKYLRNALWRIRAAFREFPGFDDLVDTDDDWIQLRSRPELWSDVETFDEAYGAVQTRHPNEFTAADAQRIDTALQLYLGCLLANWTSDWSIAARDRFHQHYMTMLDKLAEYHEGRADFLRATALAERLLESDPAHERTHRRLMRAYFRNGDRTSALRQYARCVDALKSELGVDPGPKTEALLARICEGRHPVVHLLAPTLDAKRTPGSTSAAS